MHYVVEVAVNPFPVILRNRDMSAPRWPLVGSGSGGAIDCGGASTYDRICFFFSFFFSFFFDSEAILVGPNVLSIIE